jgi:hypothetical protein
MELAFFMPVRRLLRPLNDLPILELELRRPGMVCAELSAKLRNTG